MKFAAAAALLTLAGLTACTTLANRRDLYSPTSPLKTDTRTVSRPAPQPGVPPAPAPAPLRDEEELPRRAGP